MRLKYLYLLIAISLAMVNVVWSLLPNYIPIVRIVLALPLVFVLPGYTLMEVLFRKRPFNTSEHLLFSIGLSLTIDILGGIILNMLPGGLQRISWALFLGLFTVVFSLLALYLRRGVQVNSTNGRKYRFTTYSFVMFGLATLVAIFSLFYAIIGAVQQPRPGFTQLWMLPEVQVGKSCAMRLGVRSFESTPVTYRITMSVMGVQVTSWPSLFLAPQQEWDRLVPVTPRTTNNVYVEVRLYRSDKPQILYREVHSTISNCPISQSTSLNPILVSTYNGTINDISTNLSKKISLRGVQQSGENIKGYLSVGTEPLQSNPLKGIVTPTKHIQFTVIEEIEHVILSFDGEVKSDGSMIGSYCTLDHKGGCSSAYGYGLWQAIPTTP